MRDPAEYAQGHLKGFRHAAGGQLVQATDQYVGARHATIVLHDNDGVRATMTAHWLMQMDWNEDLCARPQAGLERAHDRRPSRAFPRASRCPRPTTVAAGRTARSRWSTPLVIDLDTSLRYRDGHVPGAWFAVRANLAQDHSRDAGQAERRHAHRAGLARRRDRGLAAPEAEAAAGGLPVAILDGGMKALARRQARRRDRSYADGRSADRRWYRPYDFKENIEAAMRQYLDWEVDLVPQVKRDGDAGFSGLQALSKGLTT